ncbi:MAG: hypothetical protein H0X35_13445 [Pseudonocardiales bacterium]|nr:hypothetical protein [Pseudonocardiales bacterium]
MTNLTVTSPTTANQPVQHEGIVMLLLHEALARSRMREAEQAAREHALARALIQGRRWRMLARYADRRAAAATAAAERVCSRPGRVLRNG